MSELRKKFIAINDELNKILFERDDLVEGITLAILAKTNILALGPAGAAKSMAVNQWAKRITGSQYFRHLITKYTTPEEILGPVSFEGLRNDKHIRVTTQMLPEADLAFLDEVFKGNSGILNALLELANERIFKNGPITVDVPLYTMIAASNEIPDEEDGLDAFFDRFLLKFHIDYIQEDSNFAQMLITEDNGVPQNFVTREEIAAAQQEILSINIPKDSLGKIVDLARDLRSRGLVASDRTYKKSIPIIKASAWLKGNTEIEDEDLEVLKHIVWFDPEDRKKAERYVLETINPKKHKMIEVYTECKRLTDELDLFKGSEKEKASRSVEVMTKINTARNMIKKFQDETTKIGRDPKDASIYLGKLARLQTKISVQATGMNWVVDQYAMEPEDDLDPLQEIKKH